VKMGHSDGEGLHGKKKKKSLREAPDEKLRNMDRRAQIVSAESSDWGSQKGKRWREEKVSLSAGGDLSGKILRAKKKPALQRESWKSPRWG